MSKAELSKWLLKDIAANPETYRAISSILGISHDTYVRAYGNDKFGVGVYAERHNGH